MSSPPDVEGWLTHAQAEMLADAAGAVPAGGQIVEIGSYRGRSTIVLATAASTGVAIVAIDPHAGNDRGPGELDGYTDEAAADRAAFERNLDEAGVRSRVEHVSERSERAHGAVSGSIDLLFVDGAHRFRPARADVSSWGGRVADGGTMLIHDAFSSVGVTGAIVRELLFGTRFRYVARSRSLALYRADLPNTPTARLHNTVRQLAQLGWFVWCVGLKVLLTLSGGRVLQRLGRPVPEWPY